jgi:hypothetical protein
MDTHGGWIGQLVAWHGRWNGGGEIPRLSWAWSWIPVTRERSGKGISSLCLYRVRAQDLVFRIWFLALVR